jgi:bifunctional UDP-N-acetylglucosamine pyrophosphorylase/glucosamine-1-phosphate N-acetyltransferase
MSTTAIVLAAGQGTRMKSQRAKVLFELAGRPMLHHVLDAAFDAGAGRAIVVVGFDGDAVAASLSRYGDRVKTAVQAERRGTGHAVGCALTALDPSDELAMILCGDTPLVRSEDLAALARSLGGFADAPLSLLTCKVKDPTGYGRILRDGGGRVHAIREHRDASETERAIDEVNPAMYLARTAFLREAIGRLEPNNAQGELYFTDVVAQAATRGGAVAVPTSDAGALAGINDRAQLFAAEEILFERIADRHRKAGVTVRGGARIDASVVIEADATIEPGVVLRGATVVGAGARIDVGSVLTDVAVGAGAVVLPYSVATKSSIGEAAQVGPFSHVRPDSEIGERAHIGNFVETKKTIVRKGAKANHLAYLGDGDIGEGANVGAGTIFCNYDGFKKHRTEIGAGAFIGSDSQIVAPRKIGAGAYVATGTTVTVDVPDDALAIARVKQENKLGYASKLRARLKAGTGK